MKDNMDYEIELLELKERNKFLKAEYDWLWDQYKLLFAKLKNLVEQK